MDFQPITKKELEVLAKRMTIENAESLLFEVLKNKASPIASLYSAEITCEGVDSSIITTGVFYAAAYEKDAKNLRGELIVEVKA